MTDLDDRPASGCLTHSGRVLCPFQRESDNPPQTVQELEDERHRLVYRIHITSSYLNAALDPRATPEQVQQFLRQAQTALVGSQR